MAATKQSKAATKHSPQKITPEIVAAFTPKQKLAHYETIMANFSQADGAMRAREEKCNKGIKLSEETARELTHDLNHLAMLFSSIRRLSMEIGGSSDQTLD